MAPFFISLSGGLLMRSDERIIHEKDAADVRSHLPRWIFMLAEACEQTLKGKGEVPGKRPR